MITKVDFGLWMALLLSTLQWTSGNDLAAFVWMGVAVVYMFISIVKLK